MHIFYTLRRILLRMENASDKVVDKIRIYILYLITSFTENRAVDDVERYGTARHRLQYVYTACTLHAGFLRLQTNTENM
jgi:hypothetical protein